MKEKERKVKQREREERNEMKNKDTKVVQGV